MDFQKPAYYIKHQFNLFPTKVSPYHCSHCGEVTIHYVGYKNRLICNQCGWYEVDTDFGAKEVNIDRS